MTLRPGLALASALCLTLPFAEAFAQPTPPVSATAAADANRLFADSRLIVRDRISVEVIGAGPDLLFTPGLASPREPCRPPAERLRGRYRLHLIQVAGFAGE